MKHRQLIRIVWVLIFGLLLSACGPENRRDIGTPTPAEGATPTPTSTQLPFDVTPTPIFVFVRLSGNAGTAFRGQIQNGNGSSSIEGTIEGPRGVEFVIQNPTSFVSVTASKSNEGRQLLRAELFVGGELVSSEVTDAEFGSVTVNGTL